MQTRKGESIELTERSIFLQTGVVNSRKIGFQFAIVQPKILPRMSFGEVAHDVSEKKKRVILTIDFHELQTETLKCCLASIHQLFSNLLKITSKVPPFSSVIAEALSTSASVNQAFASQGDIQKISWTRSNFLLQIQTSPSLFLLFSFVRTLVGDKNTFLDVPLLTKSTLISGDHLMQDMLDLGGENFSSDLVEAGYRADRSKSLTSLALQNESQVRTNAYLSFSQSSSETFNLIVLTK